jgi:hypothetical protein
VPTAAERLSSDQHMPVILQREEVRSYTHTLSQFPTDLPLCIVHVCYETVGLYAAPLDALLFHGCWESWLLSCSTGSTARIVAGMHRNIVCLCCIAYILQRCYD